MLRGTICAIGIAAFAAPAIEAFSPASSLARTSPSGLRASVCSTQPSNNPENAPNRRQLILGLLTIPLVAPSPTFALKYDPNDPEAKQAYLDDIADDRKARYGRQPTRTDTERNVKKIIAIRTTLDACADAIEEGDAKGVAEAIGDLSVEATKKNANLGLDIPVINKAKPYMFTYASLFSKGRESPLTIDLKKAATEFFAAMETARSAGLKNDLAGATAAVKAANTAMRAYADAIEAETLDGRINSVKVTVMGIFDEDVGAAVDSVKANKANQQALKGDKKFL